MYTIWSTNWKLLAQEIIELPSAADFSIDAVYAHDASLATDFGLIVMRPGKPNRAVEGRHHRALCQQLGIPIFGEISAPGTTEAGDIVWLDPKTLLVGRGFRTNAEGIEQLRRLLAPKGVEKSYPRLSPTVRDLRRVCI